MNLQRFNWLNILIERLNQSINPSNSPYLRSRATIFFIAYLITDILMWIYFILMTVRYWNIYISLIGFFSCCLHFYSYFVLTKYKSFDKAAFVLCLSGFIFQYSVVCYQGGFESKIALWLGVLPFLGGFIAGQKQLFVWTAIGLLGYLVLLILEIFGVKFEGYTPSMMQSVENIVMIVGWFLLNVGLTYYFLYTKDQYTKVLEKKSAEVEDLVRVLCHDIANPLTTLKYGLNQFTSNDPTIVEKALKRSERSINHINSIIANVRLLQQTIDQKISISLQIVDVDQILRELNDAFEIKLREKNIRFEVVMNTGPNKKIMGNHQLILMNVFSNIMSNAIKFSHQDQKIVLTVSEKEGFVRFSFRDYGIGIPPAILSQLFERSAQTSRNGTSGEKGTGFGMSIVKLFVVKLHGRMDVKSTEKSADPLDHGTEIGIEYPLAS